ncbi:TetR/AcrR family transcriptional regulator [Kribbella capetownensis]|uniref:TetR/AcrR family transcriptional regulator n=1 Tax=Kribbella capetownensis TaxID=1572659 RepID=A0A4V2M3U0_9ACTN|nr:TetR/AcrR family transcriptional regulator [Kribbella capetownensis]TCC33302.1 TetR/AcrR family transcriptional regulator [Kribbella capetownensis]
METGRRERKKQQTRQAISDVATTLFLERGFDAVTVAEVARAADVAVQTVFNHFPAKEDLFFDEPGWWMGPARAVREAPPGADPVNVLEAAYLSETRERFEVGHLATWKQFVRTIEGSPALLARRRLNAAEMETSLAEALDERNPWQLRNRLIAAQFAAAQKVLEEQLMRLLPDEASADQVRQAQAELERAITEVFGVLRHGLALPAATA